MINYKYKDDAEKPLTWIDVLASAGLFTTLALLIFNTTMENLIKFIRKWLKLDAESMLHGGARLNYFWQAEHRNIAYGINHV